MILSIGRFDPAELGDLARKRKQHTLHQLEGFDSAHIGLWLPPSPDSFTVLLSLPGSPVLQRGHRWSGWSHFWCV